MGVFSHTSKKVTTAFTGSLSLQESMLFSLNKTTIRKTNDFIYSNNTQIKYANIQDLVYFILQAR